MTSVKSVLILMILFLSVTVTAAWSGNYGKGPGKGRGGGYGQCSYAPGASVNTGPGYVDKNGDGVCDYRNTTTCVRNNADTTKCPYGNKQSDCQRTDCPAYQKVNAKTETGKAGKGNQK